MITSTMGFRISLVALGAVPGETWPEFRGPAGNGHAVSRGLVWRARIDGSYSASPVYADVRIYFFNRDWVATVIEPGREFKVLAVNHMDGDQMMASPVVADNALFLRTRSHLYRIEQR